ncbi:MAG TPA: nitrous oxide reductase accessory protein NosL [Desulfatirhabdiaceae bacterium]|nr:nitrous oxide reductase accessory protein NosL [Desulfatirhabdiaceae bacterium]
MKRRILFVVLTAFLLSMAGVVWGEDDIQKAPSCKYCGMDRAKFAHSRMLVTYDDGTTMGTCSIHCLAVDLAQNIDKMPSLIQVGDFNSKKLIDAEKAFWVIGGNKPGVMTKQAKWAFEKKEDADRFIMENGGTPATYDEAMKAAYESMYTDTKMIRDKRKMMKMKGMGHQ